ncbi:MAG: ABC transporter [Negativicutes bacterium]|nr:ABC transporter [Negativicutes bacterium]
MESKQDQTMIEVAKTGGQTRWLAITALFLAIGVILRLFSPSIAGITPNWMIPMYCLAILIVKPNFKQALGIGLVAGAVCVATSKSVFPYANLVSEPLGALVCAGIAGIAGISLRIAVLRFFAPGLVAFIGTLASGLTFITITSTVAKIPFLAMLPVVLIVAGISSATVQILYYPVVRLFDGQDVTAAKEESK